MNLGTVSEERGHVESYKLNGAGNWTSTADSLMGPDGTYKLPRGEFRAMLTYLEAKQNSVSC